VSDTAFLPRARRKRLGLTPRQERTFNLLAAALVSAMVLGWAVSIGDQYLQRQESEETTPTPARLLASRLTDVPGSSDYVDRGAVCYSNRSKTDWLGVPAALIAEHGAVSEAVAEAMAARIRSLAGANVGVGLTGIAGPGGGTPQKPVGTVAIAVKTDDDARVRTFQFMGGRDLVKFQASQTALNMVRLLLTTANRIAD